MKGRWLPAVWVGLAAGVLLGDYLSGPFVSLSLLFVIPVVLAARYSGGVWGSALGVLMPLVHFGFSFAWPAPWSLLESAITLAIRVAALLGFALLVARVTRQESEIRVLRGLLPICGFCKKIRTGDQKWQQIEFYISEHSEARFTHSVCPECAREHYPEYAGRLRIGAVASIQACEPGDRLNGEPLGLAVGPGGSEGVIPDDYQKEGARACQRSERIGGASRE